MKTLNSLFLFVIAITLFSFGPDDKAANSGYKPGDKARDFSLMNIDGKKISLTDFSGNKGVILIFTCNHCPFSVAYEDRIIALDKKYAPLGYPVLAINSNDPMAYPADSYENMIERANEKGFSFPYVFDETQEIAKAYGAMKTPHVYLLSRNDNVHTVQYVGAIDDNSNEPDLVKVKYVENALAELMAGKPVSVSLTKAIGCGIKWKK
jgi:peroxiredoxin